MKSILQISLKTTILCTAIILNTVTSSAQDYNTLVGVKLAPSVGYIFSNKYLKNEQTTTKCFSYSIHARQNIYKQKLFIETGLGVMNRGYELTLSNIDTAGNTIINNGKEKINLLSIPIFIVYKHKNIYAGSGYSFEKTIGRKFILNNQLVSTDIQYVEFLHGIHVFTGYERLIAKKVLGSVEASYSAASRDHTEVGLANLGISLNVNYVLSQ